MEGQFPIVRLAGRSGPSPIGRCTFSQLDLCIRAYAGPGL